MPSQEEIDGDAVESLLDIYGWKDGKKERDRKANDTKRRRMIQRTRQRHRRQRFGGSVQLALDDLMAAHAFVPGRPAEGVPHTVRQLSGSEISDGHPGLTDDEMSQLTGISYHGVRKMRIHRTWGVKLDTLAVLMWTFGCDFNGLFKVHRGRPAPASE